MKRASVLVALALAFCSEARPVRDRRVVEDEARASADRLKSALMAALKAALEQGGPQRALAACSDQAQVLTASLSTPKVRVGRASHRLRNKANQAPAWLQPRVDVLTAGERVEAELIDLGGGRFGYYEPIVTQPMCTTCHGIDLEPELQAAVRQRYPDDVAVGFAAGDIRGLVWVEINP